VKGEGRGAGGRGGAFGTDAWVGEMGAVRSEGHQGREPGVMNKASHDWEGGGETALGCSWDGVSSSGQACLGKWVA